MPSVLAPQVNTDSLARDRARWASRYPPNSLSSHDVPGVNSHYCRWREALLRAGVQRFELRADAAMQQEIVDLPLLRAPFVGLHAKAMVIDTPALAEAQAERMTRDMSGANSCRLALEPDGSLRSQSEAGELDIQPCRRALPASRRCDGPVLSCRGDADQPNLQRRTGAR